MPFSRKKHPSNPPPAKGGLASQPTQQPQPVCTWSTHAPQSGPSPLPFPRSTLTLTATGNATGELFLFGGFVHGCASSDLYVFSTRDFSVPLLRTSGVVPTPRGAHGAALVGTTTLLICITGSVLGRVLNHDSLYLLNLGTSDPLMSSPTLVDHTFALTVSREWSMVPGRAVATTIPQPWSVPSSSSLVARLVGRPSAIWTLDLNFHTFDCGCSEPL
jgi:hypothetical protein